jgi:hypothetical protein
LNILTREKRALLERAKTICVTKQRQRLPIWVYAADVAALILLGLGAYVLVDGGFVVRLFGLRISFRSAGRVLLWAAALLTARHFFVRRPALHEWAWLPLLEQGRADGPLCDDVERFGHPSAWYRRSPGRRLLLVFAVTLLFAALTAVMTFPQVRHLDSGVSPDIGDPLLSTWRLSWVAHQITRDPIHLFDANIFHPTRRAFAFSDSMLVPALMGTPLIWLGVPQLVAYNLLFLSGFALSGVGMFVLVRSLTGSVGAALVAGFVFAFLPFRFVHYAHLELQMAQWMPLCLWGLHRTVQHGRIRDGLMTGLFLAFQTLSAMYYAIFFATFLVPLTVALLLASGRERLIRSIGPLAAGAVLAGVLVAPVAIPYLEARQDVGQRPEWEVQHYSATPTNYLAAHPRNALFHKMTAKWGNHERELFQGFFAPLVAAVALWPPLSAARIAYLLALVMAFEASLGFNGLTYHWLYEYLLPYKGLRVPARMAMLVGLALSVLVGYGVARLTANRGRSAALGMTLAIAGLVFVEYRSTLLFGHVWTSAPPVYERLRNEPESVLLELPVSSAVIHVEPVYMYFSTFHWHRLVNGYSGFSPPSYPKFLDLAARLPTEEAMLELRRRSVDFVVVHGALFEQESDYAKTIAGIDRDDNFELVGVYPWNGKDTRLYRVLPNGGSAAVIPRLSPTVSSALHRSR